MNQENIITVNDLKNDREVSIYLKASTLYLMRIGFTEHGIRHATLISDRCRRLLEELGYSERECELGAMAGYLHDIANMINRYNHGGNGAMLAYNILTRLGVDPEEIALIISAIGNHEEQKGMPVNAISAALILADKSDVDRNRVTNKEFAKFDKHDRVNYAAHKTELLVDKDKHLIMLKLQIDNKISPVMEYFDIFLDRMVICKRSAQFLGCQFGLNINDNRLL